MNDGRRVWDPPLPRLAAIFGLASCVLGGAAGAVAGQVHTSADDLAGSVREIAHHPLAAEAGAWLFALGLIAFVPFFLGLTAALGERVSGLARAGAAFLIAFCVMNAPANLAPFVIAHDLGAGVRSGDAMSQTVAEGLLGFFRVVDAMSHVVFAIGALLTAAAMVADGRFPRWLPAVLAVGGLVMVLFSLSLAIPALELAIVFGSALSLLWIVPSSLWLLGVLRPSTSASR
jgi:Domain of unknown function (DUF4386)